MVCLNYFGFHFNANSKENAHRNRFELFKCSCYVCCSIQSKVEQLLVQPNVHVVTVGKTYRRMNKKSSKNCYRSNGSLP